MTGRDLIQKILSSKLENAQIFVFGLTGDTGGIDVTNKQHVIAVDKITDDDMDETVGGIIIGADLS